MSEYGKRRKWMIAILWLVIWQAAALLIRNPILFAGPVETAAALIQCLPDSHFWLSVGGSWLRICAGLLVGSLAGVVLAVFSYRYPVWEAFLQPLIHLIRAVPVAAFAVLLLIWWGSGALAVWISLLVVLPYCYSNMLAGLKNTDRKLLEMAEVFQICHRDRIWYLYRPAVWPFLESAVRTGAGMAWKSGVAAEVIGIPALSIGEGMYLAKISLDTAQLFAWTAVVIGLSYVTERAVLLVLRMVRGLTPACTGGRQALSSGDVVLAAEHVSKQYGENKVIEDVSREFNVGQIEYFRTPSGSGKTTFLRLLAGLEVPDSGRVKRQGRIAFLFQEDRLCEEYSAVKNVALVTGREEQARTALEQLLPAACLEQPVSTLSGGMRRRAALVRTMEAEADIYFLDEPFAGLDAENSRRAAAYIEARSAGKVILIASHDRQTGGRHVKRYLSDEI